MVEPKRILIVRFSSIGDIVLTTPIIRTLAEKFPKAQIDYLTKPQYASLLASNPYISTVRTLSNDWGEMVSELKSQKYDVMIDLHHNLRTRLLRWNLRISTYTFDKLNIQKWITVNLHRNVLPDLHIVDRYFKTIEPLGVQNDGKGLDYFIPINEQIDPSAILPSKEVPFTVFAIGGQHATKKLPEKKLREVIEQISGYVILIGGPEDADMGDKMAHRLDNVFNQCGELSIHGSASIIEQSSAVITHDTGMMHIAAAFKKKILSIWGNTIPEFGMYPYMSDPDSKIFEVKDLGCRPCSKIGFDKCPKGHFKCMNLIPTELIIEKLDSIQES